MPAVKTISSPQNALVKKVLALKEKSRERKKTGLFAIEGERELKLAIKSGYSIETLLFCPEISRDFNPDAYQSNDSDSDIEFVQISLAVYEKMAHRSSTEGVLAIARAKSHGLNTIALSKNPLLLVAQSPEKPGNLGALLRTADAAGLDAVLIADATTDLYNPNVIRSSVGCVFTKMVGIASSKDIIAFLKQHNIRINIAELHAATSYTDIDFKGPSAIVVGTESTGLTEVWLQNADENIIIPMYGVIDSMNVSVSAAILIFEARRQRTI